MIVKYKFRTILIFYDKLNILFEKLKSSYNIDIQYNIEAIFELIFYRKINRCTKWPTIGLNESLRDRICKK